MTVLWGDRREDGWGVPDKPMSFISSAVLKSSLRVVCRALSQEAPENAARVLMYLVMDHPIRESVAESFKALEESLSEWKNDENRRTRREIDQRFETFVDSVLLEVWKR